MKFFPKGLMRQLIGTCTLAMILLLSIWPFVATADDPHLASNPVYLQLIEEGVQAQGQSYRLPPPTITDDMGADEQMKIIDSVVDPSFKEHFFRDSISARHIVKLDTEQRDDGSRVRIAHFWFAAKADMQEVAESDFFELFGTQKKEDQSEDAEEGHLLTEEELAKRGIKVHNEDPDHPNENYGYGGSQLLKKVEITATNRSYWTTAPDSALGAVMVDPRFDGDERFPNTWQKLTRDEAGKLVAGEPHPYSGCGGYAKVIQLHQPEGYVLVEGHMAFVEPRDWFNGANLLGSKIPALVQTEVRDIRKALRKAAAKRKKADHSD